MAVAAVLLALAIAPLGPVSKRNSAADSVAALSKTLGIDFDTLNPKAEHPASADLEALGSANFGSWLDSQILSETDGIEAPPPALRDFLRDRRDVVWALVSALEKDVPEWEADLDELGMNPRLLPTVRLEKLILAVALVEEREGNRIDASRALEASWSLGHSARFEATTISQLISTAIEKFQVGTLRKMRDAPLAWQSRLSGGGSWSRMLDALTRHGPYRDPLTGLEYEDFARVAEKAFGAVVDELRKAGPCALSTMTDEDVWKPAARALSAESSTEKREIGDVFERISLPSVANQLRRAARVEVDRELTLKVLRLRMEKEGSRDGRWPVELTDPTSAVCSTASYVYRATEAGMELRFQGSINVPNMGVILPLSFRSGKDRLLPTLTPTPTPTPDPEELDSDQAEQDDGAPMSSLRSNGNWWRESTR